MFYRMHRRKAVSSGTCNYIDMIDTPVLTVVRGAKYSLSAKAI